MKKVLWSVAAATLILTLTACAGTAGPVQSESRQPQPVVEITPKPSTSPAQVVESEPVSFSASIKLSVDDGPEESRNNTVSAEPTHCPELKPTAKPSVSPMLDTALAPAPKETPAPAVEETPPPKQAIIIFNVTTQKGTEESPSPASGTAPEPEPTQTPAPPTETPPSASAEPAFSIDYWIAYAQNYARDAGLNLDTTAVDCWDNPITAGAHCTCLERDIQSRLNRYGRDDSITDVWIWAEPRADGSYDLYIGYV